MATANRFRSEKLREFIKTSRGKSYTVGIATAFLVLGLFMFAVFPAFSAILAQSKANQERSISLSQIEYKREVIRDIISTEQNNRAVTVALTASLPDNMQQAALIQDLLDLHKDLGLSLVNIRFAGLDSTRSNFDEFEISGDVLDGRVLSITVDGKRQDLERFVARVEEYRRIVNLRNISVSRRESPEGGIDPNLPFRLTMQAEVYFWNLDNIEEALDLEVFN